MGSLGTLRFVRPFWLQAELETGLTPAHLGSAKLQES